MTRLGLGTYAYAWAIGVPGYPVDAPMDVFAFLRRAAALNLRLVQIADNLPLDQLTPEAFNALLAEAKQWGIAIEVGTRGINHAHLRRYLTIAQACGSSILRIVVDTAAHHPTPDEVISTLRAILPEFAAAGITLAIENHDRFSAKTLAHIVEALASPYVGICLDTVNSFGALEGPEVVIDTLGPYVVNLHVKDFEIHRLDHNMGFALNGTPAGRGMLNVPQVLARLAQFNRTFNAILELWPAWEESTAATITKEAAWVQESIPYLRTLIKD
ncbi:MAG: sugar phosphate isomerase/epimerase [Anaerolineae bacterium]